MLLYLLFLASTMQYSHMWKSDWVKTVVTVTKFQTPFSPFIIVARLPGFHGYDWVFIAPDVPIVTGIPR